MSATRSADASLRSLSRHYGARYRWLLLLAVMVGTMASVMSSTIINVAIPDMSHHFALGQERAQWAASAFMVTTTVGMLCTPWLLSALGYRRTYVVSMLLLLGGGVGGGLAGDFSWVLAARAVEGLAAGVVQPIPAIIIMHAFEPQERGRAGGIFGMGVVLAPALGPSIGGVLVDLFGWRSIFFMVLPFCVASIALAYRYVPRTAPNDAAADWHGSRLDVWGLVLAAAGTVALLNGMVAAHAALNAKAIGVLGLALACGTAFVWWQRRLAQHGAMPLVHPDLFRFRAFAMGSLVSLIYGTALFGSTYLLPLYIQVGHKISASHVGVIMLPAGIALALTMPVAGRLSDLVPVRWPISAGLALLATSFLLMLTVSLGAGLVWITLWVVIGRIGLGFILPSLTQGAMHGLDARLISQGASTINFLRMLGGAVGVSLCGIVIEWRLAAHGDSLSRPETSAARLAAFDETFALLALVCASAVLAAWQMRAGPRAQQAKRP